MWKLVRKADPLSKKFQKGEPEKFDLDNKEEQEANEMKNSLIKPSFLVLPENEAQFVVETKAWDMQVHCIIQQDQTDSRPDI